MNTPTERPAERLAEIPTGRLRVLMIAPHISGESTGEGFVAFKFAEALAPLAQLTIACFQRADHTPLGEQLPDAEVITWPQPEKFLGGPRFRSMFKPDWPLFCRRIHRLLRSEAGRFDIGHQIIPLAMRRGLPVIAANYGGPGHIVDDSCGLKVEAGPPAQFAADIAAAIRRLAGDAALRQRLGEGARRRVARETWPYKAARLEGFYRQALAEP